MTHDAFYVTLLMAATLGGCWPFATPHPEDAHAPRDFYQQVRPPESKCDRAIAILPAGATPGRPHKEVASISTTCSPGAVEVCERRMRERACELGADAVLLIDGAPGPSPSGASNQSLVSRNGRAIKWEP